MYECSLYYFDFLQWIQDGDDCLQLSFVICKPWASNPRFIQLCVTVCPLNILVIAPCKYNKSCGVREDLKHISSHQRSSAKWLFSFTTQCINIPSSLANKSNFSQLQRWRINRTFIFFNRQRPHFNSSHAVVSLLWNSAFLCVYTCQRKSHLSLSCPS